MVFSICCRGLKSRPEPKKSINFPDDYENVHQSPMAMSGRLSNLDLSTLNVFRYTYVYYPDIELIKGDL